jgi:selenophosphate synthetase-related protein
MGGLAGSLLMLLESSGVGADLDIDRVPRPSGVDLDRWLACFPSYGFVLAVRPAKTEDVLAAFSARGIASAVVGAVEAGRKLTVSSGGERELVWDLAREGLTRKERAGSGDA